MFLGFRTSYNLPTEFITIKLDKFDGFQFNFNVFLKILSNNFTVSMLLAIGGYLTSGILTFFVLLWNGVNLGYLFTIYDNTNLNIYEFISFFIYHGIFEFTAFILFANIGFLGIRFYKNMFLKNIIKFNIKLTDFFKPSVILIFAAFIETFLISSF